MSTGLKLKIIALIKKGKPYSEISNKLGCTKATVAYHSKTNGVISKNLSKTVDAQLIKAVNVFYKTHTLLQTARHYNLSVTTIKRYCSKKRKVLTESERRAANYAHVKKSRAEKKQWAVEYKGGSCEICGYSKNIHALEFHHKDPKRKKFTIAATRYYLSKAVLKKELDKCLLLCANCHRELHSGD